MKVRIELQDDVTEEEVVIRCGTISETVQKIHQLITDATNRVSDFTFYKRNQEYYFPLHEVLFFETEGDGVYAHTMEDSFLVKFRLYELENLLPREFIRISKTTIINVRHIYSINRNITSASLIRFHKSHKQVYVSRLYYKGLKQRLDEVKNTR